MAGRELAGAQEGKVGFLIRSSWAAFRSHTKVHMHGRPTLCILQVALRDPLN